MLDLRISFRFRRRAEFLVSRAIRGLLGLACCVLVGPVAQAATAGSPPELATVTVELTDARQFRGDIAPATDATLLWLRSWRGSITIDRPIAWSDVVRVVILGQEFSGDDLRQCVTRIRQRWPAPQQMWATHSIRPVSTDREIASPRGAKAPWPRVRHLNIDVTLGWWNDTVEADGLVIHVYPVDENGQLTTAWGTLEVDLTGRGNGITAQSQQFISLGRWVVAVRGDDFGPSGAVYQLPFQAIHPELDTTILARGTVHARLSVSGQGTFDTTASTVRIRPSSPMRDDLQRASGQRFFPQERTSRPVYALPSYAE